MASLETLTLEVSGNASQASNSLSTLIGSLRSLAKSVGTALAPLREINSELKRLSAFGNVRLPSFSSGVTSGARAATRAVKEETDAVREWQERMANTPLTISNFRDAAPMVSDEEFTAWQQSRNATYDPHIRPAFENATTSANGAATAVNTVNTALEGTQQAGAAAQQGANNAANGFERVENTVDRCTTGLNNVSNSSQNASNNLEQTGEQANNAGGQAERASRGFGNLGSSIARIAKTMLIRTALRSLMSAFSDAYTAAYNYSHAMGGEFATNVDKAKTLLTGMTTNIVSAFSPALSALIPVITTVASVINYLCSVISSLFSLLGMTSDLIGVATDSIQDYADASSSGSSANSSLLASFDELNVISSSGGGGSSSGTGSYLSGWYDSVTGELDAITQLLVGEGLIAVGLILACTGHIAIGIALMAVGAASVAQVVTVKWGELSQDMRDEIVTLMSVIGIGLLGIGAVIAFGCPGSRALGIGMMIAGAANVYAAISLSWDGGISDELKSKLTTIGTFGGAALVAIGAVLAFSGAATPLGIGMMVAGGVSLASAVALNWDSLSSKIESVFRILSGVLSGIWSTITSAAKNAWSVVTQWWEDSGLGDTVRAAWSGVKNTLVSLWNTVKSYANAAWTAVSAWWETNVTENVKKEGVWGGIKGFFTGIWNTIKSYANSAWSAVTKWWEDSGIGSNVRRVWNDVCNFLRDNVWNPVKNAIKNAWTAVEKWWNDSGIGATVRAAWETTKSFLINDLWNPIKATIENTWNAVKRWWTQSSIGQGISRAWEATKTFLSETLWKPISDTISSVWGLVEKWWTENVYEKIKGAWESIKSVFADIFSPINAALNWIKELFGYDGKSLTVTTNVNVATSETTSGSYVTSRILTEEASKNQSSSTSSGSSWLASTINNVKNLLGIGTKAEGGYDIPSGDLFIANENGNAEMIGSIGGHTSVANQEQIIEGIRRGVSDANSEQNALLRKQNQLLSEILQKDTSVKIGASAALGRTVSQSLAMYGSVGG